MSDRIEGLSIGLDLDTLEIERGLTGLRDRMRTLNAEMRNNLSNFDRGDQSIQKYETRIDSLNKKVELQERITKSTREEYQKMVREHGEGSKEAERAKRAYEQSEGTLNNLKRSVENTTKEMEEFRREQARQETSLYKMGQTFQKTGDKLTSIGKGMTSAGRNMSRYVTAPIVAAGGLVLKVADDFDQAYNTIRTGTGATGQDLENLKDSFRAVFGVVPNGADEVSQALADLNTLTGLTGTELEDLTVQFLNLGKITGEDVPTLINRGARVFGDWGIEVEDQADRLDYFFKVSQNTGVEVNKLMDQVVKFGAPMRQLGFDLDTTTVLLGAFEKEGVNTELVMGSMRQALGRMAREGIDAEEGLRMTMEAIKNAGSASEANAAAIELFGARAGPDMAAAIREGRFEIDDLLEVLAGSEETIKGAAEETRTLGERFGIMKNEAMLALEPLGEILLDLAMDFLPVLSEKVGELSNWLQGLSTDSLETGIKIAGIGAAIGPVLVLGGNFIQILGGMSTGLGKAMDWGSKLIATLGAKGGGAAVGKVTLFGSLKGLSSFMLGPWGLGIAAMLGGGYLLYDYFKDDAIPVVDDFGDKVSDTTTEAINDFQDLHSNVTTELTLMFANSEVVTEKGKDTIVSAFGDMYTMINDVQEEKFAENTETLQTHLFMQDGIIDDEEQKILSNMERNHKQRQDSLDIYYDRVQEIMTAAYEENRELTEWEERELLTIQERMQAEAIRTLSANEQEQLVIKERLSTEKSAIDARSAAETVQRSKETRDAVVAEAEGQYEETIAAIMYERDVTKSISSEKAAELIQQAQRQRDGTVSEANLMHDEIVGLAKSQADEHVKHVDWETGEVLSKWQVFRRDLDKVHYDMLDDFKEFLAGMHTRAQSGATNLFNSVATGINGMLRGVTDGLNAISRAVNWTSEKLGLSYRMDMLTAYQIPMQSVSRGGGRANVSGVGLERMYADGTDSHPGGLAVVGDGGMKELILYPNGHVHLSPDKDTIMNLPRGTQVVSGPETKDLMSQYGIPKYAGGIGNILNWAKEMASKGISALSNVGGQIWDWATAGGRTLLSNVMERMGIVPPGGYSGMLGELVKGAFLKVRDFAFDKVDNLIPEMVPGGINFGGLRMTSGFGPRRSPGGIGSTNHRGVDFAGPIGSAIIAQTGGRVADAGFNRIRGNYVRIKQGLYDYMYQHNQRNLVATGEGVRKGQTIATLGSTGASTGPHLHFEIWRNGTPINPEPFIGGFADGGLVNQDGLYNIAEGGWPEFVIPTDPGKRSNAMKLLALAAKKIQGNKKPHELPTPPSNDSNNQMLQLMVEQNKLLKALLLKKSDLNVSREVLTNEVEEQLAFNETGVYF